MKTGFEILYSKSIPEEDINWIMIWLADKVKNHFWTTDGYKTGRRSKRFYSRGILGLQIWNNGNRTNYYFRRLVKNRRVFGVVHINELEDITGKVVTNDECMCTLHDGGKRVRLIKGFDYENFNFFCRIGEIRG